MVYSYRANSEDTETACYIMVYRASSEDTEMAWYITVYKASSDDTETACHGIFWFTLTEPTLWRHSDSIVYYGLHSTDTYINIIVQYCRYDSVEYFLFPINAIYK